MSITNRFSRIGIVLLPIALLAVFFKYLHPLISILKGIESADLLMVVGVRKTILILFISFFAIWALLYISFVFFVRITKWVWSDTNSKSTEIQSFSDNSNLEVEKERQRVEKEWKRVEKERLALDREKFDFDMDYQKWAKEKKDEIDSSNKVWEESFPTADEHLDKMDDPEKNNKEESKKE